MMAPTMMAPTHNDAQWLALGLTLASRWPLINALSPKDRAKIRESLRRMRVMALSARVSSEAPTTPPGVEVPGWFDPTGGAGVLHRGEYRGVRGDPRYRHGEECPWARELWPLSPAGDVVPCACGVADGLTGAVAGGVDPWLWAEWERIERDLLTRKWFAGGSTRQRKRWRHDANGKGTLKTPYGVLKVRARAILHEPIPRHEETWETLKTRITTTLLELARERERTELAMLAGWIS